MSINKSKKEVIIGINTGHDGGVAIIINGIIKNAISEERLNRKKYSAGYLNSLVYCLNINNLNIKDISLIVLSNYNENYLENHRKSLLALGISSKKIITVDHHLSHAYGVYFSSSFDDALILVIDGQGNKNSTESYYLGKEQIIKKIGGNSINRNPAKGIGRTYEAFSNFLGWTDQEAGKTMALASYGDFSKFKTPLFKLKELEVIGALDYKYEKGVIEFAKKYSLSFGPPYSKGRSFEAANVAAYVQKELEEILIKLISKLVKKTGKRKLCLTGGVALNCAANMKILQSGVVDDIFVLPASSDKGQCLGNAFYGLYKNKKYNRKRIFKNDYLGKKYSEKEIILTLQGKKHIKKYVSMHREYRFKKQKNIEKNVAKLLSKDKIVAWFQGESELGPRALGHRSILCNPGKIELKNKLNQRIKHRESFRPFAPSCLLEKVSDFFVTKKSFPYMLFSPSVIPSKKSKISCVVHIDGSSRIQTVTRKENNKFYNLIKEFYDLTEIPMILNTSFNSQEPIVETPEDALSTFLRTEIDYLVIDNFLIWKKNEKR